MDPCMARNAEHYSIRRVFAQLGILSEGLDVVELKIGSVQRIGTALVAHKALPSCDSIAPSAREPSSLSGLKGTLTALPVGASLTQLRRPHLLASTE